MGGASLNSESNVAVSNARITQNGAHAQSQLHGIYKFLIFLFLQTVVIFLIMILWFWFGWNLDSITVMEYKSVNGYFFF